MSLTFCPYAVIASLVKAEDFLGQDRKWETGGERQTRQFFFLSKLFYTGANHALGIPEIEAMASTNPLAINRFLRNHGFDLSMGPIEPDSFATACVMDALAQWMQPGKPATVTTSDERSFEGVHHKDNFMIKICQIPDDEHPAVCVFTTDPNIRVWMKIGPPPADEFDLVRRIRETSDDIERDNHPEDLRGTIFPMVDLVHKPDLDWLIGLNTIAVHGYPYKLAQAMAEDRLRMNLEGIRAQSATVIKIEYAGVGAEPVPYIFDRPFYLWIERNGLRLPLFTAYVTEEHWRNPGSLG